MIRKWAVLRILQPDPCVPLRAIDHRFPHWAEAITLLYQAACARKRKPNTGLTQTEIRGLDRLNLNRRGFTQAADYRTDAA